MINTVKKRLNRKGFTLAEVLVTVAIIIILAGVTFVSVAQYQKNLRLMEMDGTAKEIFIAAQNHLSVAKASGDLDRLKSASGTTDSPIGTKLSPAPSYAGNTDGEYYYVIHNVTSGSESYTPSGSDAILQMMLPFGALDETVSVSGNYAIVYELKSASVVAVLYSGAGNASFGNAAVITLEDEDVKNIETKNLYQDKSARKSYEKNGVTAIVGCYTGTAGSAAIPTETLEAPKLEVKNENKLHVIVSDKDPYIVTLIIRGVQSGTVAKRILQRDTSDGNAGTGTFDVTLDDITGDDGSYRFANIISSGRFTKTEGDEFIPGENIEISARVSSKTGLATPKESAKYTVSSLFGDANETKDAAGNTTVYIRNLRHLENLGANVSDFTAALGTGTTSGSSKIVNITAEQKNEITMFSMSTSGVSSGNHFENLYGSKIYRMEQEATFAAIDVNYPLVYHGNQHEIHDVSIGAQTGYTAAGIFGRVADPASATVDASLSVRDLILRNDRVSGTNVQNAGMLVGETTKDLTVDGVLAYYHEDNYDETKDSSVEVTASENAGGLIGLVAGGKLDVKNSAAAVYVKGGKAAGGFIGSVSGAVEGSTIVQSYAGGHTKNGAYSTTDVKTKQPVLTGAGRYNVQASGNAGGFIGVATNNVSMNAVYTTASAYSSSGDSNSNSFAGSGTPNIQKIADGKKNYYAIGTHNGKDADGEDIEKAQLAEGQNRRQATAYDRTLMGATETSAHPAMDKTSYPLNTVRHLCTSSVEDKDLPWFIKEHVGDWTVLSSHESNGKFEIDNDVRLELKYTTKDTSVDTIRFHVEGKDSKVSMEFAIHVTDNGGNLKVVTYVDNNKDGNINTYWDWSEYNKKTTVKKIDGNYQFILYLDDITTNTGHFATITKDRGFYIGEDLIITAYECTFNNWQIKDRIQAGDPIETNSLFKKVDWTTGTAYISSARHLENLDELVSGLNRNELPQDPVTIKHADISCDILWTSSDVNNPGFLEKIDSTLIVKEYNEKPCIGVYQSGIQNSEGFFVPIRNTNLESLNGNNHIIKNLAIKSFADGEGGDFQHSSGIFGYAKNPLQINNLKLENVSSQSFDYSYAGALIGAAGGTVSIENVSILGNSIINSNLGAGGFIGRTNQDATIIDSSMTGGLVSSNGKSGGLIGENNQHTTIENVCVTDTVVKGSGTSGGFVGFAGNGIKITKSGFSNIKITSTTDAAGGFVGSTGGAETTIKEVSCNGKMIVKGKNASGGIIGQTNQSKVTVDKAEFLSAVEVTAEATHAGGVIGISGGEAEIKNTTFSGGLTVNGANSSGGIIGNTNGKLTVDWVTFDSDVTVTATSANVHAGGIVGYANGEADIKNTTFNRKLAVSGENSSAGIIGKASGKVTVNHATFSSDVKVTSSKEHAAGVLGDTNSEADIENVTLTLLGKIIVCGYNSSGGILGNTSSKMKLWNISLGGSSTITSFYGDAGGMFGFAKSSDMDIQNVKFIGKDTEVIAKQNAGGLCGTLTENKSKLTISNVAVSAFIQAEQNAGGLIGRLQTSASEGKIEKSYYGGRTKGGQYASITINNNTKEYKSNIHGSQRAGGLIGYIDNTNGLTIEKCFSTGAIENGVNNQIAGGFIGATEQSNINIKNCYSIGKVDNQNKGGFIGYRINSNLYYENARYLNTFNDPSVKAIGNGSDDENNNLTTKYADDVLGKNETSDQTVQTNSYDDALNGEIYPYKNWTTDWESKDASKPIAYYGDWPLLKLNGSFVYFDAIDTKNYKNGGRFNIYSYEKDMNTILTPYNTNLESSGFGIISDVNKYDELANFYRWSYRIDANDKEKMPCKIEGSEEKDGEHKGEVSKYSKFSYLGKEYYFYRCTFEGLENLKNDTIFVWAEKGPNKGTVYKVDIYDNKVSFQLMPNTNPTLNP